MYLSPLARDLYEEISELTVVDAHEHLPAEADYLAHEYCGPNMFAGGYIWHDLESAGMDPAFKATLRDPGDRPVAAWWPQIRPFWRQAQHTSFARALRITARSVFGLAEINDATIDEFAAKVRADNTPGIYRRTLQERCRIRCSITCVEQAAFPNDPGLRGITPLLRPVDAVIVAQPNAKSGSLADAAAQVQAALRADLAAGAVGFKMTVADFAAPDPAAAERELRAAQQPAPKKRAFPALRDYLFDKALDVAAAADVPVAVHTGYWGDFRQLDPKRMFSYAPRRRDVRFDMFHLGMPMVRDAALIGKTQPNITLNLTWCPIISQRQTARMLAEIIDLVPSNKVIAFGGDYRTSVQKVYGHLVMAREAAAAALAERVEANDFDRAEAMRLAQLWFHDNPARVYGQNASAEER